MPPIIFFIMSSMSKDMPPAPPGPPEDEVVDEDEFIFEDEKDMELELKKLLKNY
jgi:hypothetical protein